MTTLDTVTAGAGADTVVNQNNEALSPAAAFGIRKSTTAGLVLGYYGGTLDGVNYSNGTHTLTASTTRYVVVARATGVVSSATGTTNWNDTTNYLRMGVAVVGTSTFTWTDWRQGYGGAGGGGGSVASVNGQTGTVVLDAGDIGITDAGGYFTSTDVEGALQEIGNPRVPNVQSVVSSATVTPTFSNDAVKITAQNAGLTLANPTGTAIDMLGIVIRIKDDGTARTISYGAQYRAIGITLPTITVIGKTTYIAMIYNNNDTKWDCVATGTEA